MALFNPKVNRPHNVQRFTPEVKIIHRKTSMKLEAGIAAYITATMERNDISYFDIMNIQYTHNKNAGHTAYVYIVTMR
jgi:hypothetical protein